MKLDSKTKQAARKFVWYWTFRRGSEKEIDISIKAGRIVGDLYKELLKRYGDNGRVEHEDHVESCLAALGIGDEVHAAGNRVSIGERMGVGVVETRHLAALGL